MHKSENRVEIEANSALVDSLHKATRKESIALIEENEFFIVLVKKKTGMQALVSMSSDVRLDFILCLIDLIQGIVKPKREGGGA